MYTQNSNLDYHRAKGFGNGGASQGQDDCSIKNNHLQCFSYGQVLFYRSNAA